MSQSGAAAKRSAKLVARRRRGEPVRLPFLGRLADGAETGYGLAADGVACSAANWAFIPAISVLRLMRLESATGYAR